MSGIDVASFTARTGRGRARALHDEFVRRVVGERLAEDERLVDGRARARIAHRDGLRDAVDREENVRACQRIATGPSAGERRPLAHVEYTLIEWPVKRSVAFGSAPLAVCLTGQRGRLSSPTCTVESEKSAKPVRAVHPSAQKPSAAWAQAAVTAG